jgi:hypothetical protein
MTNGDVTVKVNDVDAIPDGEGDYTIAEGASVTVTAVPESGDNFVLWSSTHDAEDGSTTNPLTFNMPTEDVLMGATFANPTQEYDILVDDAIVGGSVSVAGDLTKATAGTEITLTATPAENYVFDAWAVEDENSNPITVTENKFTMPAAGVIVSATFNRQYTITYYINGVEQTPVKRIVGTPINIEGLTSGFAGWSTNSSVAEVEYTNSSLVSNDMTLYAVFVASIGTPSYKLVEADQADWRGKYLIAFSDDIFADGRVGKSPTTDPGIGALGVSVDPNSKLTELAKTIYKRQNKEDAEVVAVHAGVECGRFKNLKKELDMINIGPDITDAHTIRETLYMNSIPRVWNLLEGILESYPNV